MRDDHRSPPSVEQIKVCTAVNKSANLLSKDQGQVDLSTHGGSSDLPLGEKLIVTSSTEALANDTATYVLDTRHENSVMIGNLKQDDKHRTSAINKCGTDELIISTISQQQLMGARTISDSVTQEVPIEKPSTHDKSSDLSFVEKCTPKQPVKQSNVSPVIPNAQMDSI